jgi:hypothetical protein
VSVPLIRFKRGAAAASESVLPLLAIAVPGIGLLIQAAGKTCSLLTWPFYAVGAFFAILWGLQTWFGYVRKTHDPTWVLKYQEVWDSPDGYRRRRIAADAMERLQSDGADLSDLKAHHEELSKIDDALDMLEDVGFYVLGEQISPEAAHHHFFWWIQGYWCCAHEYINAIQTDGHDPTRWQNIKPLFEITSKIELGKARGKLSQADLCLTNSQITEFLDAETDLPLAEPCCCQKPAAQAPESNAGAQQP